MLKKFPSDRKSDTKNAVCFLSWAPTHNTFTFNLQFLHELKYKVRLSKTVCVGFSILDFVSFLLRFTVFLKQMSGLCDLKRHNSSRN